MKVVVTGGGTIAPIDDVRHIANASSGRFSAAITEAWLDRGADVRHIHAPGAELPIRRHLESIDLDADSELIHRRVDDLAGRWRTARERLHLVPLARGTIADYALTLQGALGAGPVDVVMLAMAASDYEPTPVAGKIGSESEEVVIRCRRAQKVIGSVRAWAPQAYLVGFKLLSGATRDQLVRAAEEACRTNRADLTVANDLRRYRAGGHEIHLVRPGMPVETFGPGDGDLARLLVERVSSWASRS